MGTRGGGLAEVVDGRVARVWDRSSGLPNDDALALAELRLAGGRRESGWARARGWRGATSTPPLPAGPGSPSALGPSGPAATVLSIGEDRAGRIYLGTQRGVVRLTPACARSRAREEFASERFGVADGLPSATANWGSCSTREDASGSRPPAASLSSTPRTRRPSPRRGPRS